MMSSVSAVGHLVQGAERCQDAAPVGLHHVSVLDHLIQDDVDSIQVEHDLKVEPLVKETNKWKKEELLIGRLGRSFCFWTDDWKVGWIEGDSRSITLILCNKKEKNSKTRQLVLKLHR